MGRFHLVEMQNALQSVENDQSKFEEAKRGCESQKFHANEEEQGLKANLALMSAARDHAEKAIKAAGRRDFPGVRIFSVSFAGSFLHAFRTIGAEGGV